MRNSKNISAMAGNSGMTVFFPLLVVCVLGGCSLLANNANTANDPLLTDTRVGQFLKERKAGKVAPATVQEDKVESDDSQKTSFFTTPRPPKPSRMSSGGTPASSPAPETNDAATSTVALENMPLPQFINAIYGVVLKRNVSMDPEVQKRTDLVSLRTGKPLSPAQLALAGQAVLRSYGLAVNEFQGLVRVVPETNQSGYLPEIRRGRAQPDVPASLRPVFYLAELEHTYVNNVSNWLRTLFPGRLTLTDDAARNAILLSGQSDTVSAAMEAIQLLDQPMLRGHLSARITPVFWSADEMAKRLVDVLMAEGYAAALNPGAQTPILVMPIGPVNSVIVFATNEQVLNHVLRWARDLDQTPQGRNGSFMTYYVRNTDATDLAKTLQEVMGGATVAASGTTAAGVASTAGKKVVVNAAANSLIIRTSPAEYQQWYGLLQELDRPARSALIMATVAEVRLTDSEQFGFNWLLKQFVSNGMLVSGGVGIGAQPANGVFRLSFASMAGDPRALLTALASSNRIRILSNPSIVALNGQTASIQVGQEVPILTSQVSNANTQSTTGTAGILQTIQYRNTGVILRVKPVIHAGGRIDLEVSQEVSAAQKNETGVESSPIILTRRVETRLSLLDGNTALLGGLISENNSSGDSGLPFLKDIPVAGALFRTSSSMNTERTELVVLLTPHVIGDDFDASAVTDAFRSQFSWASTSPPGGNGESVKSGVHSNAKHSRPSALPEQSFQEILDEKKSRGQGVEPLSQDVSKASGLGVTGKSTGLSDKIKREEKFKSKAYELPESDPPSLTMSRSVAPMQQRGLEAESTKSQQQNQPVPVPRGVQPVAPLSSTPPALKTVEDESLKQELLKALRNQK